MTMYLLSEVYRLLKKGGRPRLELQLIPICVRSNAQAYFGIIDFTDPSGRKLGLLFGPNHTYRKVNIDNFNFTAFITEPTSLEMYEEYVLNMHQPGYRTIRFGISREHFAYIASQYTVELLTGHPYVRRVRYPSRMDFLEGAVTDGLSHHTIELDISPAFFFHHATFQD